MQQQFTIARCLMPAGTQKITATFKDIGAKTGTTYTVYDVLAERKVGTATETVGATVGEHDIAVLRLSALRP